MQQLSVNSGKEYDKSVTRVKNSKEKYAIVTRLRGACTTFAFHVCAQDLPRETKRFMSTSGAFCTDIWYGLETDLTAIFMLKLWRKISAYEIRSRLYSMAGT